MIDSFVVSDIPKFKMECLSLCFERKKEIQHYSIRYMPEVEFLFNKNSRVDLITMNCKRHLIEKSFIVTNDV